MKLCEWSPQDNASACWSRERGHMGCQNEATVMLGVKGVWLLCASCADLPRFARYKNRVDVTLHAKRMEENRTLLAAEDLLDGLGGDNLMEGL